MRSRTGDRRHRLWHAALGDGCLFLVSLSVALCAAGDLAHVPDVVLGRLVAEVTITYAVTMAARLLPPPSPAPLAWGLVVSIVTSAWLTAGATTAWGFPTVTTITLFAHRLRAGVVAVHGHAGPWRDQAGIVLLLLLAAGVVAACTASLWAVGRVRRRNGASLGALAPALCLFCAIAVLDRRQPGLPATVAFVACGMGFLAYPAQRTGRGQLLARRSGAGAVLASLPVVCAVVVTLAVGFLAWSPEPVAASPDTLPHISGVGTLALEDDLPAVEIGHSSTVMFLAHTPTPTYWQVATLNAFDGTHWTPGRAPSPANRPQRSASTPTFQATVRIRGYEGPLLPVPPRTERVAGAEAHFHAGTVTVSRAQAAHPVYRVTALDPPALRSVPAVGLGRSLGPGGSSELALPRLPHRVVALAHRMVAHARGDIAKAQALQSWFTSGRYRYTLGVTGRRALSLTRFLFTVRAGGCQQFAAAFGVLARLDGLPTRLAIGFTEGTAVGKSTYEVVGGDAHAWPEVYLGTAYGWVSFEPTPAATPSATAPQAASPSPTSPTAPRSPVPVPVTRPASVAQGSEVTRPSLLATWWPAALAGLVALVILVVLVTDRRRRSGRRTRQGSPVGHIGLVTHPVLDEWARACVALSRQGLERDPHETLQEHARRVHDTPLPPKAADSYAELVTMAGVALYSDEPIRGTDAHRAAELATCTEQACRELEGTAHT